MNSDLNTQFVLFLWSCQSKIKNRVPWWFYHAGDNDYTFGADYGTKDDPWKHLRESYVNET